MFQATTTRKPPRLYRMEFLYADESFFQAEDEPKLKEANCNTSCCGGDEDDADEDSIDDKDEVAAAIMLGLQGDCKKNDSNRGTEILDFTTINHPVLVLSPFGEATTKMKTPPLCRWNNTTLSSLPSTGRDDYSIQEVSSELDVTEVSAMLESPSLMRLGSMDDSMGLASHQEEFLERPNRYALMLTDRTSPLGGKRRDGRINYCIGAPPPITMKKMKLYHDNHHINNYDLLNPVAQQTLMNEPIEHEYDALISGYYGLEYVKSNKSSLSRQLDSNMAPIGAARKDVFDATEELEELEDTTNHIKTGEKLSTEPRVGLDSWQMQVLHRMMQKLPPKPQAMFKAYAARAIDRHLKGHVANYCHLPGSIFEDLMIAQMDAELFLETYIAVRNEMHQLENVTAADVLMKQNDCSPPTHHHHQSRHCYHHPNNASTTQLAMGYAFCLGMKHGQTRSFLMGGSTSLDSILEQAKIKMSKVPPLERGRIWNEIVECVHVGHGSFFDGPFWTCQQVVYSDHYIS